MLTVHSFTFSPIAENTYILSDNKGNCAIIDPGCYYDDEKEELAAFIESRRLKPVLLLNTHCHLDHVFGNKFVAEKYNLILHIHPEEKKLLDFAPASGLMYNLPFDNYNGEIQYIIPGNPIQVGEEELEVLFTPGHSPGSVTFYHKNGGFAISGDALFQGSIGRTDLPGGNFDILVNAIRSILFSLPEQTKVYSGHGNPTTIGDEKQFNPFLQD